MKLTLTGFNDFTKLLSLIKSEVLVLDTKNKNLFSQDVSLTAKFPVNLEGETLNDFFVLNKSEVLHLAKFENSLEISDDYSFQGKVLHGKLSNPSGEMDYFYLPVLFSDLEENAEKHNVQIKLGDLEIIKKASNFTNPLDEKIASQCVNINDQITSANSFSRTYYHANNLGDTSVLLNQVALKSLFYLGADTLIKDYENSILLTKNNTSIILQKIDSAFIPITEMLVPVIDEIMSNNHLVLDREEFSNACSAMSLYARKNTNNRTLLTLKDGSLILSVDETTVEVPLLSESNIQDDDISFNFNLEFLNQAISQILSSDVKTIDIYEMKKYNVYVLSPSDGEVITLGKLII